MKNLLLSLLSLLVVVLVTAQPTTRNQNSSRSNHTRTPLNDAWSFGFTAGPSVALNNGEQQLFRGNGFASGLQGQYFLGPVGFGLNAGFVNSPLSNASINQFIIDRKFPQGSTVTSTAAQNAFLLAGPTLRLGSRVQLLAGLKGGVFFNQGGSLIIGQQGAVRPFYRFDAGTRSLQPGWNGSVAVSYPLGTTTALQVNADFLRSSTSVQLFDPQRGIDIPVEQKRNFQTINAGISFIKTFTVKSPRDPASGQATGKRSAETNDNNNQTTQRVLKTKTKSNQSNDRVSNGPDTDDDGVSIIDPENKRILKTRTKSNQTNERTNNESCGPVVVKTTKPDGTVEEQTFSCPDDAIQYQTKRDGGMPNRISTNVTVPKQTQGTTFGEKVNQGMQAAGSHIIAGKIVRNTESKIVTNKSRSDLNAAGAHQNPGVQTNLYVQESGSGMATGKRSGDAGSGLPTGRRQYQPLHVDGLPQEDVCNPCLGQVKNNPLYTDKGGGGTNPLYKGRTIGKEECDDKNPVVDVQLIDRNTGAIVATTKTNACGEYWFANVPEGNYSVAIIAAWASKKGYDYYKAQSDTRIDIAGEVLVPDETWHHIIYGRGGGKVSVQDLSIVVADTDGDGLAEVFRATGTFTDGTVHDFTQSAAAKGGGTGKVSMQDFHFTMSATNQRSSGGSGKVSVQDIHFTKRTGYSAYQAIATFSDGRTQDISEYVDVQQVADVLRFSIQVADTDDDGATDLIWSPRSNFGASSQSAKVNVQDLSFTKKTAYHTRPMAVHIGDVDGDGMSEMIVGNGEEDDNSSSRPGNPISGLTIKGGKNPGGDTSRKRTIPGNNNPYQPEFPLAIPGNPIGGISIKGGKNPGGLLQQRTTNSLGEFEFSNLEPGNYQFVVEATYIIYDITDLDLDEEGTTLYTQKGVVKITASQNSQSLRTSTTGGTQPNTRAQDHNSTRSNKTASSIAPNPVGTDSTNTKAQDHNSTRSNKTASSVAPGPGGTDTAAIGKSIRELFQTLDAIERQLDTAGLVTKATINTSRSNTKGKRNSGNGAVDSTGFVTKANINTSRSNSKGIRNTGNEILTDINNGNYNAAKAKLPELNRRVLLLQQTLNSLGADFTSLSNVLKTKHDTVKNSVSNIR